MDFSVDVKQQELIDLAKTIAEKEIAPRALRIDKSGVMDEELLKVLKESGMTQLSVPKEYGGAGIDLLTGALISEQLSKGCAGVATICAANSLASFSILFAGSDMQKRDLFDCLNRGGMACFALTEPGAGSDAGAVSCRAEKVEGGYILNGTKCFITNAPIADKITLFANTREGGGIRGLTVFLVDADTKGISIGKEEDKMGIRASATAEIIFEDCFVPDSARVGKEGRGFMIAMQTLQMSRPVVAAISVGIAQAAIEVAVAYSHHRKQFGVKIATFEMVQQMIADMVMKTEAARILTYKACVAQMNKDKKAGLYSAMSKCFASDTAMEVTTTAVQVMGGNGYSRENPVEKYMRDAKIMQIYEGTNQVQRLVIANEATF
ncbi:MAG: acyl-CoA dehydrogenase family protein [Dialister sp.]|uniref:acyl-CoA dehydrogenase family protein n=1 Tax=Dialister sp. TaxID=1955814 RepID=UPI00257C6808|nr:acyl-CoA dehydrogenase family protein [Dialister sp.]MBS6295978.1 acyl-CoA dehydrogenase family protein [Dialister sp.]